MTSAGETAWIAVLGTLGGSTVTGVISLLLAKRSQSAAEGLAKGQREHERDLQEWSATRRAREVAYARAFGTAREISLALRSMHEYLVDRSKEVASLDRDDMQAAWRDISVFGSDEALAGWEHFADCVFDTTAIALKVLRDKREDGDPEGVAKFGDGCDEAHRRRRSMESQLRSELQPRSALHGSAQAS